MSPAKKLRKEAKLMNAFIRGENDGTMSVCILASQPTLGGDGVCTR